MLRTTGRFRFAPRSYHAGVTRPAPVVRLSAPAPAAAVRARLALAGRALAGLALAAALAGCAASRPDVPVDAGPARAAEAAAQDTLVARLARRAGRRGDATLDVLLLSGGGQNGAFGTGFLRGWRARTGAAAMPTFDLVTGVSTGALQAPFAVLGTEAALAEATEIYRTAAARAAPRFDPLFLFRRTGGLYDVSRLRAALGQALGPAVCRDLAAAFADGRQLAVGTVDLDAGVGRTWVAADELGPCDAPAGRTDAAPNRLATLLLASSAIPALFPPVDVDGRPHVDGGVSGNLRPVLDLDGLRALDAALRARGARGPVTVRLWTVVNIGLDARGLAVDRGSVRAVSQRTTLLTYVLAQRPLVESLATAACAAEAALPGLRVEFRAVVVPDGTADDPGASALFDGPFMARLDALGAARAASARPWDVAVRGCTDL